MQPWQTALTFGDVLDAHVRQRPEKLALAGVNGQTVTFGQMNQRINRLYHGLSARGVQTGDRVAILSYNRPEYLEVFGLSKAGLIIVPLNWRLAAAELLRLLSHSGARVLVAEASFVPLVETLREQLPGLEVLVVLDDGTRASDLSRAVGQADASGASESAGAHPLSVPTGWLPYESLATLGDDAEPSVRSRPHDVLCIVYTSGTTGAPKGVKITHQGALDNCRTSAGELLGLREDDHALAVLPLFHVGGMWYHLFPSFATGCSNFLMPQFDPAVLLQALQDQKITNVHLVPTMVGALIHHPGIDGFDLSHLRLIMYAASSMPAELLRRAMLMFPQCSFAQGYGSTEAGTVTGLFPVDHVLAGQSGQQHLLVSCGHALQGREIRILDADHNDVAVGGIGELVVRSPGVMAGYWNDDALTRTVQTEGWVHTGDLARCDDQGYYYIVDRKNDMIITGGENVYPTEVESFLYADPRVLEAAVFGVPDPKWVERVVAAVVLKPGETATAKDIVDGLRRHLAAYNCPKDIYFVADLPKSGAGKVLRKMLRDRFGG